MKTPLPLLIPVFLLLAACAPTPTPADPPAGTAASSTPVPAARLPASTPTPTQTPSPTPTLPPIAFDRARFFLGVDGMESLPASCSYFSEATWYVADLFTGFVINDAIGHDVPVALVNAENETILDFGYATPPEGGIGPYTHTTVFMSSAAGKPGVNLSLPETQTPLEVQIWTYETNRDKSPRLDADGNIILAQRVGPEDWTCELIRQFNPAPTKKPGSPPACTGWGCEGEGGTGN
ncbi:MAG: hypothetical protein GXP40_10880 [Chloroflexi bacterium]|nr:hypothetical protein [Chloroflexota bacterium]